MLKAVLLDLDNTLILFDELEYYNAFFQKLNDFFSDEFTQDELKERVVNGTMALRHNNGEKNNLKCFLEVFARGFEEKRAELWERFLVFYRKSYDDIKVAVAVPDGLHDGIGRLRQTGLKLVIASNPIFPMIAQKKRMQWGNLDPEGFDLFTDIENMSYVKPTIDYYCQACKMVGERPEACLMVGNDPVNDMAAAGAGLRTYRTTDAAVVDYAALTLTDEQRNKSFRGIPDPDYEGLFSGVADVVERLMGK